LKIFQSGKHYYFKFDLLRKNIENINNFVKVEEIWLVANVIRMVMSKFELAIPLILKHEGGFVDNPADPGGATNRGISLRYLNSLVKEQQQLLPELDLDNSKSIDAYDIKNMSLQEATKLYEIEWWQRYNFGGIDNQLIATKVFDLAVNMGASEAIKLLQRACCRLAGKPCLTIDGELGGASLQFINQLNTDQQKSLLKNFCDLSVNYYQELVKKSPLFGKFLDGWLNRVNDYG